MGEHLGLRAELKVSFVGKDPACLPAALVSEWEGVGACI